ncbi:hypothetical protein [Methanothrix sp.]
MRLDLALSQLLLALMDAANVLYALFGHVLLEASQHSLGLIKSSYAPGWPGLNRKPACKSNCIALFLRLQVKSSNWPTCQ